ncbi:ADP-ribose pyrophosphatase YjhB, NUDIX family [Micromonospora nigra]|uniref:ADP-ribose pyrophosphatase YjhB, NUDIX family n=1 Tax=Micromonospora nigra TaxID=145857 RepID=A0A1C6RFQ4_9ACTN|nr:NUDIX hydrolase [Micromonospora nigra]SCL15882.1 ADP-ribose pyrophosphatase YjhB, NUDIX family [Micromonospora nigra]
MRALTWAVAAVVTDGSGRVLLCRQSPPAAWYAPSDGHPEPAARYALPGGRLRPGEGPVEAVARDILTETGWPVEVVDLVGLYRLLRAGPTPAAGRAGPPPDVLVHVFRARVGAAAPATRPAGGCHLSWHAPPDLPEQLTPTTRAALADALAGRSGVLRTWAATPRAPSQRPGASPDDGADTRALP